MVYKSKCWHSLEKFNGFIINFYVCVSVCICARSRAKATATVQMLKS